MVMMKRVEVQRLRRQCLTSPIYGGGGRRPEGALAKVAPNIPPALCRLAATHPPLTRSPLPLKREGCSFLDATPLN
ncbi:MAG: hypothetical protein ACFWUL_11585 [Dialister sp.]